MNRLLFFSILLFVILFNQHAFGQTQAKKQLSIGIFYPTGFLYKNPENNLLEENAGKGSAGMELKFAFPIKTESFAIYLSSLYYKNLYSESSGSGFYAATTETLTFFGGLNTGVAGTFKFSDHWGFQSNLGLGYYLSTRDYKMSDEYGYRSGVSYQDRSVGFEWGANFLYELDKIGFTLGYNGKIFGKSQMIVIQNIQGTVILKF